MIVAQAMGFFGVGGGGAPELLKMGAFVVDQIRELGRGG